MATRYVVDAIRLENGELLKGGYLLATRSEAEKHAAQMNERSKRFRFVVRKVVRF